MMNWRTLFLRLWNKAVGTPGYNKGEWMAMQRFIEIANPRPSVDAPLDETSMALIGQHDRRQG